MGVSRFMGPQYRKVGSTKAFNCILKAKGSFPSSQHYAQGEDTVQRHRDFFLPGPVATKESSKGFKVKEKRFRLDIKEKCFMMRVVGH